MFRKSFLIAILSFSVNAIIAQVASDCSDAIPICNNTPINGGAVDFGDDDFAGQTSSGCLEQTTSGSIESNSAWYQFRTSATGRLGINIGHDPSEDWDFALYLADDCSNLGDPIRCNFYDNSDENSFIGMGEDPTGDFDNFQYEDWIEVSPGQNYYLLINNFSSQNSGFSIQFSGDVFVTNPYDALDCSIISNLLGAPITACASDTVTLDATTAGAVNYEWYENLGSGFTVLTGENNATLPADQNALYRVRVTTSTETIVSEVQVSFSPIPTTAPLNDVSYCFDENTPNYDLSLFDDQARGSQLASEVVVSYFASESDALSGVNPLPKNYVKIPGVETIYVRTTSTQNPNCFDVSQNFDLNAVEVPSLDFPQQVSICSGVPATIGETNPNSNYLYEWNTGEQTPTLTVQENGNYTLTVTHIDGSTTCENTRQVEVITSIVPEISSIEISDLSANNTLTILTEVDGNFEYQIDDEPFQSQNVFSGVAGGEHLVTIRDVNGCGSFSDTIVVAGFSNHFSPNGDVLSETWQIEGLEVLEQPQVQIFDRYGMLLKQLNSPSDSWDGTFNGRPVAPTDYWFKLTYVNSSGNRVEAKYIQSHFALRR